MFPLSPVIEWRKISSEVTDMWKCPICGKENDTLQCTGGGFDGSRDYENYFQKFVEQERTTMHVPSKSGGRIAAD